jgi:hypothetical protein
MGLDLWFREDVARILASTHETLRASAGAVTPLDEERAGAYQQGFEDALRAVAVAFGVLAPGNGSGGTGTRRLNSGYRDGGIWAGEER